MSDQSVLPQGRLAALDRLKGLCLFIMLFLESTGFFRVFGPIYHLASDARLDRWDIIPGLQYGDCMLPLFLFLIGMSCYISYNRRAALDKKAALRHLAVRYFVFAALGSCLVSLEYLMNGDKDPIPGTQAVCVACVVCGLASLLCGALRKKMKHGDTIARVCRIGFAVTCITLILLDLPLMLCDMWDQLFYVDGIQTFYQHAFMHWSILHVFAYAGLFSLPFLLLKKVPRVIVMAALAAARLGLQCIPFLQDRRDELVLGGPWGLFGWVLCIVGGYTLCEAYLNSKHPRATCTAWFAVTGCIGEILTVLLPISSRGVSVNFLFLMAALFCGLFWLVSLFDWWHPAFDLLALWGKSPIFIFTIGLLLKVILLLWLPYDEPLWVALGFMGASALILFGVSMWLWKSKRAIHI